MEENECPRWRDNKCSTPCFCNWMSAPKQRQIVIMRATFCGRRKEVSSRHKEAGRVEHLEKDIPLNESTV